MASLSLSDIKFTEGGALQRLREALENPQRILKQIGTMMVATSTRAFKDQRFGSIPWKARMDPNFPAIIADLTHGRELTIKRFQDRPALMDRGFAGGLASSIAWEPISDDAIRVGSNRPYAGVLHEGGTSFSLPITQTVQDRLWAWMQSKGVGRLGLRRAFQQARAAGQNPPGRMPRKPSGAWYERAKLLGWLLNGKVLNTRMKIKHPARPIVGIPEQLHKDIERMLGVQIRVSRAS